MRTQWRPRGNPVIRFLHRVVMMPNGCWEFTGDKAGGYGRILVGGRYGKHVAAHRFMYQLLLKRPLRDDEFVLHRCDNRPCVHPGHLFLGTQQDNVDDMVAKGRNYAMPRRAECGQGHPFTEANTYVAPNGSRACRQCRTRNARNSHRRAKDRRRHGDQAVKS